MELDELHPSGGVYVPTPPKAQADRRDEELAKTAKSLPVIEDVIKDFDDLIAACDKLSNLDVMSKVPLESQVIAYQKLALFAKKEKTKFETKYKNFLEATK